MCLVTAFPRIQLYFPGLAILETGRKSAFRELGLNRAEELTVLLPEATGPGQAKEMP